MNNKSPTARKALKSRLLSRLRGVTAIELAAVVAILIVVTALTFNICILIFAADMCDRAARDCARAAGMMSTPRDAQNAMNAPYYTIKPVLLVM